MLIIKYLINAYRIVKIKRKIPNNAENNPDDKDKPSNKGGFNLINPLPQTQFSLPKTHSSKDSETPGIK